MLESGLHADIPIRVRNRTLAHLAWRLLAGGAVISVVLGWAVFAYELERLRGDFASHALAEAAEFARRHVGQIDMTAPQAQAALQSALDAFVAERRQAPQGHFVLAEVYDRARALVAQSVSAKAVAAETWMDTRPHRFPEGTVPWTRLALVGETAYVQVVTPLLDHGQPIGFFEGAYAVSPSAAAGVVGNALRTAALVALAVVATSFLLYPVIRTLHRRLIVAALRLLHANLDTLAVLGGTIAMRDGETATHSYRVTLIAMRLAEAARLDARDMRGLIKGAFLHDVGKVGIPDAILLKPAALDRTEKAVMTRHVAYGLEIVARADWLKDTADVVGCHHEWFDGTGYPNGLAGERIPVTARVFAIADVFDALTSARPYKPPLALQPALALLEEGRGTHFDPHLLDVFASIAGAVHAEITGADDHALEEQLRRSARRYFAETVLL